MKSIMIILALAICLTSCTNNDKAIELLQQEGYTDIEMTGYDMFGCSDKDMYSSGFKATNAQGNRIVGVVCGGYMKGYTIRLH